MYKKILTVFLLSFITLLSFSQPTHYWRFNNNGNDDVGSNNLIATGSAAYISASMEGSYAANCDLGGSPRWVSTSNVDLGSNSFVISIVVKRWVTSSGPYFIFDNRTNATGSGMYAYIQDKVVHVVTSDGTNSNEAVSASMTWAPGTPFHLGIRVINPNYARIFIDGIPSGTDSTIQIGWNRNGKLTFGSNSNGSNTLFGYLDNISTYNCNLSNASIKLLADNKLQNYTVTCSSTPPPTNLGRYLFINGKTYLYSFNNGKFAIGLSGLPPAVDVLKLHPMNPHYFIYKNSPLVIITSGEHYGSVLNLDFDYITYLNTLKVDNLNGTRVSVGSMVEYQGWYNIAQNTWAPVSGKYSAPWARSTTSGYYGGGNKFDLTKWDEAYFTRLKDFVKQAKDRDIMVEIMLFSTIYNDELWNYSPMKLANNVNNVGNITKENLLNLSNTEETTVQKALVAKIVTELNGYENVFYEICNEPYINNFASDAWQNEMITTITNTEATLSNQHLISQNVNNYYKNIINPNPATDIFNFHYANQGKAYIDNLDLAKVIGNNETGFSQIDSQYRHEAYVALLNGGAYFNNLDYAFTVNDETGQVVPAGNPAGGGPTLRKQLGYLKNWISGFDFIKMTPAPTLITGLPSGVQGHALVETGKQYAIFVRGGNGTVNVTLTLPSANYSYEWMDTKTNVKTSGTFIHPSGTKTLTSPTYTQDIALKILYTDPYVPSQPILRVQGRYLIDKDGKPFLIVADAGWSLLVQTTTADAKLYIDNRAAKGFNMIMTNVLEHYYCTVPPKNVYGQSPFTGTPFQSTYNEKYFAHVDTIIRYAASKNIIMFLGPVYLGYNDGAGNVEGWVNEINAATLAQMNVYGNYIGQRYKDFPNILWFNGGDRNPTVTPNVVAKCNTWAAGVLAYDSNHLMTAHNNSESYGVNYWNYPNWLTINNVYTRSKTIPTWYKTAYDNNPIMPFFLIEGYYEHAPTNPEWTPQEMRYPEYANVLCGGMGYVFGNCPLFGFGFPVFGETDWKPAMDRVGSIDMSTWGKFFNARKWWLLVPDWTHTSLTAGYGTWGAVDYAPAARASDGSSIIAYLPTSRTVTVNMTKITGASVDCKWFNPATNTYTTIGNFPNTGTKTFTPPASGDWVLVLDANNIVASLQVKNGKLYKDGQPLLLAGDSPWSIISATTTPEALSYLDNRKSKGIDVIIIMLVERIYPGPNNRYGALPFTVMGDFSTPNEKFFLHADTILQAAKDRNMVVLLFPAYLGWNKGYDGWYDAININGDTKMYNYAKWVANRYKNLGNIVWMMGGDCGPYDALSETRKMVQGIQEVCGAESVFSVHNGRYQSGITQYSISDTSWMNLNSTYADGLNAPSYLLPDYNRNIFPFFFIEGTYENGDNWTPTMLRSQFYWSILMGTTGYLFGNKPIYYFEPGWQAAMESQGSYDLKRSIEFFKSKPDWNTLVPDNNHTVLTAGYGNLTDGSYAACARSPQGKYVIAYIPSNKTVTIDMTKITSTYGVDCKWFNPSTGVYTVIGNFPNTGTKTFTPPAAGDWLLVLEANTSSNLKVLWQEDFESWPLGTMAPDDFIKNWQLNWYLWIDWNNYITDLGGTHNKVWRFTYPAGDLGSDAGFSYGIPLGGEYTEVWLSQDIFISSPFDYWNESTGNGGGKVLPGFAGGPHTSIPYSVLPAIADPYTNGWMVHGIFQPLNKGASCMLSTYQYFENMYDEWDIAWGNAVYGVQDYVTPLPAGSWHNFTFRVVLNDIGQENGFTETFWDGQFKTRHENMQFRNAETDAAGITKYIDKVFEGYWAGGGEDCRSDAPNTVTYDNITAYYYLPGHPDYRKGYSTTGITPVIATTHKYIPDQYVDETFTLQSDTIVSYVGSWTPYCMLVGEKVTKTIEVVNATSIDLNFIWWKMIQDKPTYPPWTGYVKIYNSSRTLLYTFNPTNQPSLTNHYVIPGSKVYIEYYSARGAIDGGWKVVYKAIMPIVLDTMQIYMAENFENWTTSSINTLDSMANRWQINSGGTRYNQQSIVNVGAPHNNVWNAVVYGQSTAPTNCWKSYELDIALGDTTSQLYAQWDLYTDPNFQNIGVGGGHSGKMITGFLGGNNKDMYIADTVTRSGRGGWAHGVWGSVDLMGYYYDHTGSKNVSGLNGSIEIPRGYWVTLTSHIIINTPGLNNGIYEIYRNGVLKVQYTNLNFRSTTQGIDFGKIEAIHTSYFYGGNETDTYAAPANTYIRLDNLIVYNYKPGSKNYTTKAAAPGTVIPILPVPLKRIVPKKLLSNENYTNPSDTIYDVGNGKYYIYWPPFKKSIITKTITLPSGTIKYQFLVAEWGYPDYGISAEAYVKIYSGTGSNKVLLATYGRSGVNNGRDPGYINPPLTTTYNINSNTATIEIYSGANGGVTRGVAIKYWQPQTFSILKSWDFENRSVGQYTEPMGIEDFYLFAQYLHGTDSQVTTDIINGVSSKVIKSTNPVGTDGNSGIQVHTYINSAHTAYNELYSSVNVKWGPGILGSLKGKIPGIRGLPYINVPPNPGEGFYYGPMFQWNRILSYHYDRTKPNLPWTVENYNFNPSDLVTSKWYNVTQRVVKNTFTNGVPNADGIQEIWLDGKLIYQENYLKILQDENKGIDALIFTAFVNGSITTYETYILLDNLTAWLPVNDPTYGTRGLHNPSSILITPVPINQ